MRVFLSYARKDGAWLANRLAGDLPDAWLDTRRIGGGTVWSLEIEQAIDDPETVVVALLTPGSYASEICRAEQLRALRKGRRLIPVLATAGADRPLYLEARHYRDFSDPARYETAIQELRADLAGDESATLVAAYRETRVTYVTAPPRVANYMERPAALGALRDTVFAEDGRGPIALTGFSGMGGIGKTVLAKALCDDEVVQQAFPDGIVWITAGREGGRDFVKEMREVGKALGDDPGLYENDLACEHQYRTTIAKKAALIVVDDVWSKADLEPLLAESPRSRFLFTTRDAAIGRFVGARAHTAALLDAAQSRALLAAWAGLEVAALPVEAGAVVAECGRLPLALSVVGAMLRGADAAFWRDTVGLLRGANLSAIEEQLPAGQESFFRAVEVSFQALKPEMQKRYRALAVLLEDTTAALPVLETLWGLAEAEARRVARGLADRSLAQWDGAGLRLHDLQLDYVRALFGEREALGLIHGAARLSAHVIERDAGQFASQMVGRLVGYREVAGVQRFIEEVTAGAPRPWLRPLHPALHPPGTPLLRTLQGHSDMVAGVTVTPDGKRAVSASWDHTLRVWDLDGGRALRTLEGHSGAVNGVAVTADGLLAVSASGDRTLRVWDLESGRALRSLEGHTAPVRGVAVTADGKWAISASNDMTLKVWDLESGRAVRTLEGHSDAVYCVTVTADGRRAISASDDSTLKVWELESGLALLTLEGHSASVNSVAVTPDGQRAISASADNTLRVWDLDSGRVLNTLEDHTASVNGVAVTPDGKRAISASADNTLRVWDLETGRPLHTLEGHSDQVTGVAVTPDGHRVISASHDNVLKVWDLEIGRVLPLMASHSASVTGVAVTPDGQRVVSSSSDKTLKVWDLEGCRVLRTLEGHSDTVSGVAVTSDGKQAVSASHDNTLEVWELKSGRALLTLEGHFSYVFGVAVTPDGRQAVSASEDNTLEVWDLEDGSVLRTLDGHSSFVHAVAVTPDGQRAVSASSDKTLKVWDLESARVLRTLKGHASYVCGVAVTSDGKQAVSASDDKTLRVWDLENGRALRALVGHSDWVSGVAVAPDGTRVVSSSGDKTLKVWDLASGRLLTTFYCDASALCCAFADQHRIVAGDEGGRVYILSLEESGGPGSIANPTA